MTEPSSARPLPGPPRSGPATQTAPAAPPSSPDVRSAETSFDQLAQRPVSEHVAVFEDEHARLQRELGTIDQL